MRRKGRKANTTGGGLKLKLDKYRPPVTKKVLWSLIYLTLSSASGFRLFLGICKGE
jgi:hypothetical protein